MGALSLASLSASSLGTSRPALVQGNLLQSKAAEDRVLFDDTSPKMDQILVRQGVPEIVFTEEIDLATTDAILVDGSPITWTLDESRYTLTATSALAPGAHTLTIGTGLQDLAGNALAQEYATSFTFSDQAGLVLFAASDPRRTSRSTIPSIENEAQDEQ